MNFLYILFAAYIFAVNSCAFFLVKRQYEVWESGDTSARKNDGKLILVAMLGGAAAVYATMFILRYRLSNIFLMISMPVLAVVNIYCFFLGFRGIYLFI